MEKRSTKNKRFIVLIILLSILLISTFTINILYCGKMQKINKDYQNLQNEYNEKKLKEKELTEEINTIQKKQEDIENIVQNITNLKKEYYSSIKQLEDEILAGKLDKKIAYLTFDDGPYYASYQFLDILDRYDVKATFFTIGTGKESCYDNKNYDCTAIYAEEAKRGHTIANHTFNHAIFKGLYDSPQSFITQIKKQENLIKEKTGITTNIIRFPGGSRTAGSKKDGIVTLLRESGYGWVDWSSEIGDGGNLTSKEQAWKYFTSSINENIEVILMHDYHPITLSILPDAIEYLKTNGYILLPLFYESNMVNK